jgi:hypothetical protein
MKQKHAPHHGEVTSIGDHHGGSGKFAVVHVAHGPRPKPPKPKKGSAMRSDYYDDRPQSTLVIPKAHASKYRIGQKVAVGASSLDNDSDDGEGESVEDAMDNYRETTRGITSYNHKRKG